jgi:uncharacterized membrane protein (DUF485 family)
VTVFTPQREGARHRGGTVSSSIDDGRPRSVSGDAYTEVQHSARFQELRRRHRSFVFPVTAIFMAWYFLYVLLADYAHDFMAKEVFGNVNVGILLGLGQFASTFLITTLYVRYANKNLDPVAAEIRHELEGSQG